MTLFFASFYISCDFYGAADFYGSKIKGQTIKTLTGRFQDIFRRNTIVNTHVFRIAKQNRIFQDVVDQIQDAILSRKLQPGELLPPERKLKEMLRTSRGTLREALRVLEQKGLIEIRVGAGGGAIVREPPSAQFSDSLDMMIRFQKISLDHLAEFREGVEGLVSGMAAERATSEDIRKLDALLAEAKQHIDKGLTDWQEFLATDRRIHQTLAEITGNPLYIMIHRMVHENIDRYYERYLPPDMEYYQQNYQDIRDIVNAVRERCVTEARILAQRHVRKFRDYMRPNLQLPTAENAEADSATDENFPPV